MNNEAALKLLFELRAVLDRLSQSEITLEEALSDDIDHAISLADDCISQLTGESSDPPETESGET